MSIADKIISIMNIKANASGPAVTSIIICLIMDIKNICIIFYYTLTNQIKKRSSLIVTEIIFNQNILSKTKFYWKLLDNYYQNNYTKYKNYINDNSYETVLNRQKKLILKIERVIKDNSNELDIYRKNYNNLTWVMSTGRCGVDALDNFFKKSKDHFSIHREFDEKEFFKYNSSLTTKSYIFNKFLYNNISNDEIYEIIKNFCNKRIKTIEMAKGKKWIFCEHYDIPWLPLIIRVFPSSKIIFLRKNPKDVIQSYLSKSLYNSCIEMPLNFTGNNLAFKSLFVLICWFYTYTNMFINIHCELIEDQTRVLKIKGENLINIDIVTYKKIKLFLKLQCSESQYVDNFSHRYNTKFVRSKYSKFPQKNEWPDSFNNILRMFYLNIDCVFPDYKI